MINFLTATDPAPAPATSVSSHPWVFWTGVLLAVGALVASNLPNILGPVGRAFDEHAKRQRTTAKESDDADIAELNRSLRNVRGMLDEERATNASYRILIAELYRYILAAQMDPDNLQRQVPDPFLYLGDHIIPEDVKSARAAARAAAAASEEEEEAS